MGLIDNKKNIFTTIGAYTSLQQAGTPPNSSNVFPSINNKKDVVPLLLDILKVVVGSDALQDLTGQLFTSFIVGVEPQLKATVKNQTVQSNAGDTVPNSFKTNGYNVKVKDIDVYGKYKIAPTSTSGSMLYDTSKPNFDKLAYQAIQNSGTDTVFGNLIINYNSNTDSFNFKPNPAINPNPQIGDFLGGFVDNMEIVNKKEFTTTVMNSIYGTITHGQKMTPEQIAQQLQVNKLISQLINDDDSFVILPEDLDAILQQAQQIANGVLYYDLGCGVMAASYPLSGMTGLISSISGSTDPFFVGNQINATIAQSTSNTPDTSEANKQTVKDGFFQKLIKLITQTLAQAVTTAPQIRTLLAIASGFQNHDVPQISNPVDDMKKSRVYMNCVIKTAMAMINKFIFDTVTKFLIALLQPVIRIILKEKINQFIKIIKSLIPAST
jgi:hypothetical protein